MAARLLEYDEPALVAELSRLPGPLQTAFAAACAERVFFFYEAFCAAEKKTKSTFFRETLDRLWDDLVGATIDRSELERSIEDVTSKIPSEEAYPDLDEQLAAEDAAAAVAYALRARLTGFAEEAGWAARRAYEAFDVVADGDDADAGVQGELRAQREELAALQQLAGQREWKEGLGDLRQRSLRG